MGGMGKRGRHITSPAERLAGKYAVDAESGCWLWTRSVNNKGYGTICLTTGPYQSSPAYAHRMCKACVRLRQRKAG